VGSGCPVLEGSSLVALRCGENGKKRRQLRGGLFPSVCETEGVVCWVQHSALWRGDLLSLAAGPASAAVVARSGEFSSGLGAVLRAKCLSGLDPLALPLLSPLGGRGEVSRGVLGVGWLSLFGLLEAAERWTAAPVAHHSSSLAGAAEGTARTPNGTLSPSPCAPRAGGCAPKGLLGAGVTISLLLCLCTGAFIHKQQLAILLAFSGNENALLHCSSLSFAGAWPRWQGRVCSLGAIPRRTPAPLPARGERRPGKVRGWQRAASLWLLKYLLWASLLSGRNHSVLSRSSWPGPTPGWLSARRCSVYREQRLAAGYWLPL